MTTYKFTPGSIAALLTVHVDDVDHSCIYMGKERGVVVDIREKPLAQMDWPIEVQATINRYFGVVFSFCHEDWKGTAPSPRSQLLDSLLPWTLEIEQ